MSGRGSWFSQACRALAQAAGVMASRSPAVDKIFGDLDRVSASVDKISGPLDKEWAKVDKIGASSGAEEPDREDKPAADARGIH